MDYMYLLLVIPFVLIGIGIFIVHSACDDIEKIERDR